MLLGKVFSMNSQPPFQPHREPIYWFILLEQARADGDLETAAQAVRRLRELGIDLKDRRKGVGHD